MPYAETAPPEYTAELSSPDIDDAFPTAPKQDGSTAVSIVFTAIIAVVDSASIPIETAMLLPEPSHSTVSAAAQTAKNPAETAISFRSICLHAADASQTPNRLHSGITMVPATARIGLTP